MYDAALSPLYTILCIPLFHLTLYQSTLHHLILFENMISNDYNLTNDCILMYLASS